MRNKLLILITASIIFFYSKSIAQLATPPGPDLQEKAAGYELVKATKEFYTGTIIGWGGGLLFIVGAGVATSNTNVNAGSGLILMGGLGIIVGTVFSIESYSHIGRAGKILMQRNDMSFGPTQNGVGLSVRF